MAWASAACPCGRRDLARHTTGQQVGPCHAVCFQSSLCALFICLVAACSSSEPQVVLYVSADDHIARQVTQAFERQTGIRVAAVGDTEQTKTTGLANRLRAERDNPQADVFWSSEVFNTINLAEEGVLEGYVSGAATDWPRGLRDPDHRWYGFAARARVIVFAPARVPPEHRPTTWMELTRPRFKGRIVMADPRFGTTGGHLAAMKAYWSRIVGAGYYDAFLMGLAANEVRLLPSGNAGVVQAVADGEADLGLTDTDDVWAARARGLDVDLVYPRHDAEGSGSGGGTLLIPNTVARVRGGPHPEAAGRLIDFLLSEQVERMLAESVSHNVPIRPDIAADYPQYAVPDPLKTDYRRAAARLQGAVEQAMGRLGRGGDAP
ncbi:MAG: extracellular solute-binding protein [Planctomycetota bacterium]